MPSRKRPAPAPAAARVSTRRVTISFRGPKELKAEISANAERARRKQSDYLRLLVIDALARERDAQAS